MPSQPSSSIYTLNAKDSGVTEKDRLDSNHNALIQLTGSYFPPVVEEYISKLEAPRIADVATGTGVWLTKLAELLPKQAQLDGYDFDTTKFQPTETWPDNVKLVHGNILEPFPEHLTGKYDLVHVRLLAFGMAKASWLPALKHVQDLLKPGGWLFWEETGEVTWGVMPPSLVFTEVLSVVVGFARDVAKRDNFSPYNLKSYFVESGFLDCDDRIHNSLTLPEAMTLNGKLLVPTITQALYGMVAKGGYGPIKTTEDAAAYLEKLKTDMESDGRRELWNIHWVWGRKPA